MIITRRKLIIGAAVSLLSAPAIVRASSLMSVAPYEKMPPQRKRRKNEHPYLILAKFYEDNPATRAIWRKAGLNV